MVGSHGEVISESELDQKQILSTAKFKQGKSFVVHWISSKHKENFCSFYFICN